MKSPLEEKVEKGLLDTMRLSKEVQDGGSPKGNRVLGGTEY